MKEPRDLDWVTKGLHVVVSVPHAAWLPVGIGWNSCELCTMRTCPRTHPRPSRIFFTASRLAASKTCSVSETCCPTGQPCCRLGRVCLCSSACLFLWMLAKASLVCMCLCHVCVFIPLPLKKIWMLADSFFSVCVCVVCVCVCKCFYFLFWLVSSSVSV